MKHVNNPYFLVNDKWNVDFIGDIKQFKKLAENYNHSTQNIHFRIKSSTVNLEAKYFWYHELFYAEKALVTIFVGQCWSVFTKFLNEKYPTLFSLLDLGIDKVEREWLFWLHEQKYKTQEIQKHAFRAEVTRKTHLAGYLRLFLSKFVQLTDTREEFSFLCVFNGTKLERFKRLKTHSHGNIYSMVTRVCQGKYKAQKYTS